MHTHSDSSDDGERCYDNEGFTNDGSVFVCMCGQRLKISEKVNLKQRINQHKQTPTHIAR
jgi:hypothetical protein